LDDSANIMDVIAGWEKEHPDIPIQFSFHRYVLLNKRGEPRDPIATHLLCHQAIGQVVTGHHLVTDEEAIGLASLQLHMKYEDEINWEEVAYVNQRTRKPFTALCCAHLGARTHNRTRLVEYVPVHIMSSKPVEKWIEAIRKQADKDKGVAVLQAEQKYLDIVRKWNLYGACFFTATVRLLLHLPLPPLPIARRVAVWLTLGRGRNRTENRGCTTKTR
jgi:hypothetical protein